MSVIFWPDKDPDDVVDYDLLWSTRLATGDAIQSSTWIITPGTLTEVSNEFTDTITKIWLSGGVVGQNYILTNRVVTSGGRTIDQSVILNVIVK